MLIVNVMEKNANKYCVDRCSGLESAHLSAVRTADIFALHLDRKSVV